MVGETRISRSRQRIERIRKQLADLSAWKLGRIEAERRQLEATHAQMLDFARQFMPESETKIELYQSARPVFDLHGVEEEIEKEFTDKLKISTTTGGKPTSQQRDSQQQDTSLNTSQSLTLDHDQQHMLIKEKSMHSLDMKHHSAEPSHVHLHMKESLSSKPSNNSNSNTIDEDNKNFYDKNLSFFDRISCEASEKSQSKPKNWKEERKMNAETFGLLQRQQQQELKSYHYNRTYNNNNYRGNNNNAGNNTNGGRNYPRNAPTSGNQQQQQSSQYRGGNMRYNNNNNGTGMGPRVAAGTGNTNNSRGYNSRRNDMDNSYNGGSRRFGSR